MTNKIIGCPHCKNGINVSQNIIGFICSTCNVYIRESEFISESECHNIISLNHIINPDFIKLKDGMEKRAYDYADKQAKLRKEGKVRTFEPSDIEKLARKK